MKQTVDYEATELARKQEQQAAVRAERKRDWQRLGLRFVLHMLIFAAMTFGMFHYFRWLDFDWFTPPAEVLTESEFRELVEGYPQLAEAFGGTYSDNAESLTRGRIEYERDLNGDGEADMEVHLWRFGMYRTMGHQYIPHEPEALQYDGRRQHYDIDQLFKGRAWAVKAESIYVSNHEAEIAITVRDPEKGQVQARAEIERLLAIVRQGEAD